MHIASVNALSSFLADINVKENVGIAKRLGMETASKIVEKAWFVVISVKNHASRIVLRVKKNHVKQSVLTVDAHKIVKNLAFCARNHVR